MGKKSEVIVSADLSSAIEAAKRTSDERKRTLTGNNPDLLDSVENHSLNYYTMNERQFIVTSSILRR